MAKQSLPPFARDARAMRELGARLRLARIRRRITASEMAERVGISRTTLHNLERGELSVAVGTLVRTLGVLGLERDLDAVAHDDELGRRLQDAALTRPRRSRRPPPK